jgi:hypothetical protein
MLWSLFAELLADDEFMRFAASPQVEDERDADDGA